MSEGVWLRYWCKHCDREHQKLWKKKQWFDDYSIKCDCGKRVWTNAVPRFQKGRTYEEYKWENRE